MVKPYNFKKAFYGKKNRQAGARIEKTLRSDGEKAINMLYNKGRDKLFERIAGMGSYQVTEHPKKYHATAHMSGSAIKRPHHGVHKPYTSNKDHESCVTHSEYLGDLISNGTTNSFIAQNYAINPANIGTFPWLSSTAINYQNYRFKKLVFEYRPLVSNSTSSASGSLVSMGKVILAVQYDSVLGAYTNSQTAENSEGAVSIKPSEGCLIGVECKNGLNPLGVYYTSAQGSLTVGANSSDIRMQNVGILCAIANGIPTTGGVPIDLGEIWVHYTVELLKPQLNAGLSNVESSHYYGSTASGSPTNNNPFGPNVTALIQPLSVPGNLLPLTFTVNSFTLPLQVTTGSYLCVYSIQGTANIPNFSTGPTVVNGSILRVWNNGILNATDALASQQGPQNGIATVTNAMISFVVQVNAPGASLCAVTFPMPVVPTSGQWDLIVTPYNSIML